MGERGHSVTTSVPGPRRPAVAPCPALSARLGCVATWDKNSRAILRLEVGLRVEITASAGPAVSARLVVAGRSWPSPPCPRGQQDTDLYHWGKAWGARYAQGLRGSSAHRGSGFVRGGHRPPRVTGAEGGVSGASPCPVSFEHRLPVRSAEPAPGPEAAGKKGPHCSAPEGAPATGLLVRVDAQPCGAGTAPPQASDCRWGRRCASASSAVS